MNATIILTCWKRFEHFNQIIEAWLAEKEVDEIIVWDNSGKFQTSLPVILINSQQNLNPAIRYAIASIAKNDWIINCDDDVLPLKGIAGDFKEHFNSKRILGLSGVFFKGSYSNHIKYHSRDLTEAKSVEMIMGGISSIHKKNLLGHDYANFCKYQLEMNLQGLLKDIEPIVIPTKNYTYLPEGKDDNALCRAKGNQAAKQKLYEKFFSKKILLN